MSEVITGMVAHGFYNRNSAPQWAAIEPVLPWLERLVVGRPDAFVWDEDRFHQDGWDDWLDLQLLAVVHTAADRSCPFMSIFRRTISAGCSKRSGRQAGNRSSARAPMRQQ